MDVAETERDVAATDNDETADEGIQEVNGAMIQERSVGTVIEHINSVDAEVRARLADTMVEEEQSLEAALGDACEEV